MYMICKWAKFNSCMMLISQLEAHHPATTLNIFQNNAMMRHSTPVGAGKDDEPLPTATAGMMMVLT